MASTAEMQQTQIASMGFEVGGDAFKAILKTLNAITDECCLQVSEDGIRVAVVDPAHVAMLLLDAPASAFDDFKVGKEKLDGIDIPKVLEATKRCGSRTKYSFKEGRCIVKADSKKYTLSTIDTTGMSTPKLPDIEKNLKARFSIEASTLREVVNDTSWMSDHVTFEVKNGKVYASAKSDMETFENPIGDADGFAETVKSCFPLEYVQKFAKSVGDHKLTVNIGADYPMKVVWNTDTFDYKGNLRKKGVSYTFLLAPRIETEDDDYQPSKPATEAEPSEAEDAEEEDTDFEECEGHVTENSDLT